MDRLWLRFRDDDRIHTFAAEAANAHRALLENRIAQVDQLPVLASECLRWLRAPRKNGSKLLAERASQMLHLLRSARGERETHRGTASLPPVELLLAATIGVSLALRNELVPHAYLAAASRSSLPTIRSYASRHRIERCVQEGFVTGKAARAFLGLSEET